MKPILALALAASVAACATPPSQSHSMASLVAAPADRPLAECSLWLHSVADLAGDEGRSSWHGAQRVEVGDVEEAVRSTVLGLGVTQQGPPEHAFRIDVLNAYVSTVAGMRAFNLVLRVHHDQGDTWVARGQAVNVPWTLSEASVRHTLGLALADARDSLARGLRPRCEALG